MFITYSYGDYEIGSEVNVTMHVFDAGEYFDPDGVDLEIRESGRDVDLTRSTTGVYKGAFVIEWDDLSEYLSVILDGHAGMVSEYDVRHTTFVETVYSRFMISYVWLEPADEEFNPGQDVTLEVQTTYQGEFVDPDPGSLRVAFYDIEISGDPPDLDTTRVAVGRYRASYSIPVNITSSMVFEVGASANLTLTIPTAHGNEEYTTRSGAWRLYGMNQLDVWGNIKETTSEKILVDLYIRDDDGLPTVNAHVSMEFSYIFDGLSMRTIGSDDGLTDENGSVPFSIDLSNVTEDVVYLVAEGNVTHGSTSQEIRTMLFVSESPETGLGGQARFDVGLVDEEMGYENGSQWLKNRATSYGDSLSGTDVYVYVITDYEVLNHTASSTNASGVFEVEYQVPQLVEFGSYPASFPTTYYHALVNGSWAYDEGIPLVETVDLEEHSIPFDGPQTILKVGTAVPGKNLSIEFDNPLADGVEEVGRVLWGMSGLSMSLPRQHEWSRWTPYPASSVGGYLECQWTGESYITNLTMPDFLPVGTEVLITPWIIRLDVTRGDVMGPNRWVTLSDETPMPTATITRPADNTTVNGTITISGTSSGELEIEKVEVRLGMDEWLTANGTSEWTFDVDTGKIHDDTLTVSVRCYDGTKYSEPVLLILILDQPPGSFVLELDSWHEVDGPLVAQGYVWDGHDNVVRVEVRVDGRDWVVVDVDGDGNWSHDLDTTALSHGDHTLEVRVSDGNQWSEPTSVDFEVDRMPTVVILTPEADAKYKKDFELNGTAFDDDQVMRVEFRLDGGDWTTVEGTQAWNYNIKVNDLETGEHTLEVRAYDGSQYSSTASVTFLVEKEEESPGFGALVTSMAIFVGIAAFIMKRRAPGKRG